MRDYFGYKVQFVMNITDVDDKVGGMNQRNGVVLIEDGRLS